MAEITTIQLKRKITETPLTDITLAPGEPLFDTKDTSLHIGNPTSDNPINKVKFYNADQVDTEIDNLTKKIDSVDESLTEKIEDAEDSWSNVLNATAESLTTTITNLANRVSDIEKDKDPSFNTVTLTSSVKIGNVTLTYDNNSKKLTFLFNSNE